MDDLLEEASSLPAGQFMKAAIDQSGYMTALKEEGSFESQGRLENLEELLNAVGEWEADEGGSISEFLDEAALLASVDDRAIKAANRELPEEAVTLMTLHNAKGLEFPVVLLVGIEENLLPHRSSTGSLQEIEEERRLLYVGVTRAQEDLFLVNCESRMSFGRTEYARPSRFLEDIPKEALVEVDVLGREIHASSNLGNTHHSARRGTSISTITTGVAGSPYKGGERVKHPRFGDGTVVGVKGQGSQVEVAVQFERVGLKHLLIRYARLQVT
jgi:DNA helicase-2/ATP-dependent DNA helicase PcrA